MVAESAQASVPPVSAARVRVAYESAGRRIQALDGVSLDVAHGEIVALVGPNGSGKTTLVRALTGVVKPDGGSVRLDGADVGSLSQREIAQRVAVVPQDPALPPAFTALEAVLMGRTPHLRLLQNEGPADIAAAREAMQATATWELASRPLGELSGGERQRVVVARALAQSTPVLLLDEPTAHLDIGHQVAVLGIMRELCRSRGKAVLAVVHDLTLAAQYADRMVMLNGGRVVAEGDAADVLRPDLIREVYGVAVEVLSHPGTGRPVVAPSSSGV